MFTYHYNAQDRLVRVDDVNGGTTPNTPTTPSGGGSGRKSAQLGPLSSMPMKGWWRNTMPRATKARAYGYKPDSTWSTDPLWLKQNGEYSFYQNDHLGTPQKLVKQNGALVWSASYSAFGQARVEVETVTNNLRFPGQYYDAETGLHYNFHRYYAPGVGRYLRTDPIGLHSGNNLFVYVENTPINLVDPSGEKSEIPPDGGALEAAKILKCKEELLRKKTCCIGTNLWSGAAFEMPIIGACTIGCYLVAAGTIPVLSVASPKLCAFLCSAIMSAVNAMYWYINSALCVDTALEDYNRCLERGPDDWNPPPEPSPTPSSHYYG